jgi:hypothetical protein
VQSTICIFEIFLAGEEPEAEQCGGDRRSILFRALLVRCHPPMLSVRSVARCQTLTTYSTLHHHVGRPPHVRAFCWGQHDPVIALKIGRRIAAMIPGARLAVIDSGHVPHTTDPEGFAAQLVPFAESVLARSAADQALSA